MNPPCLVVPHPLVYPVLWVRSFPFCGWVRPKVRSSMGGGFEIPNRVIYTTACPWRRDKASLPSKRTTNGLLYNKNPPCLTTLSLITTGDTVRSWGPVNFLFKGEINSKKQSYFCNFKCLHTLPYYPYLLNWAKVCLWVCIWGSGLPGAFGAFLLRSEAPGVLTWISEDWTF